MHNNNDAYPRAVSWLTLAIPTIAVVTLGIANAAVTKAPTNDTRVAVTAIAGQVDVTVAGTRAELEPRDTLPLPARVITGHDGTLGLAQGGTRVDIAHDSDIEIPAEVVDGNLLARLVQHRGNVFYDVAKRDAGKLRVETPLLVAVIKGTQFNVAVLEDTTTISLFEGRLEIRATDTDDIVQLDAGQIAIRSRGEAEIRVVGMNDARLAPADLGGRLAATGAAADADGTRVVESGVARLGRALDAVGEVGAPDPLGTDQSSVKARTDASLRDDALALQAELPLSSPAVPLGASADLSLAALGQGTVDVGAAVSLAAAGIDIETNLGASVDLVSGVAGIAAGAGADLAATGPDLGVEANLDLGLATNLGSGAPGASVDLSATTDTGLLGAAGLDLGLGVDLGAPTEIVLTLDLGLGSGDETSSTPETDTPPPAPPRGLGGLLDQLL